MGTLFNIVSQSFPGNVLVQTNCRVDDRIKVKCSLDTYESIHFKAERDFRINAVKKPLVKVCGVTNPKDAEMVAASGADFVGMIMWPKAKRFVSIEVARKISEAARENGAQPIAVFVDENVEDILNACEACGIGIAQLHGDIARKAAIHLPDSLQIVYVLHVDKEGKIQTKLPSNGGKVDWFLLDGLKGGSGEKLNWNKLYVPKGLSKQGWILAGGLNPDNVRESVNLLSPDIVDVSSGVTFEGGIFKDPEKVSSFLKAAKVL